MENQNPNLEEYIEYIKTLFKPGSKIVVAMSGGVDSSLTAALIKRAGFETIGITLQLYRSEAIAKGKTCCAGKDIQDAKNVALDEDFPHYVLDYTKIFKEKVIDDFINTYEAGKTPIPCGRCNQYVKFGHMLDFAKNIHADYLVTGHYVEKVTENGKNMLFRSKDKHKDQSYFLALTTPEQVEMLHFPLAQIEKPIVKKLAAKIGLVTANKSESMDICFIPDGDYKGFLQKLRPEMFQEGEIKTKDGKILGKHIGLAGYTIGQRKNLGLNDGPWYVINLDTTTNSLIVGKAEDLAQEQFEIEELSLLEDAKHFEENEVLIQIRARFEAAPGKLDVKNNIVTFNKAQSAITPGQICAIYEAEKTNGERLLGGAIIKAKIKK